MPQRRMHRPLSKVYNKTVCKSGVHEAPRAVSIRSRILLREGHGNMEQRTIYGAIGKYSKLGKNLLEGERLQALIWTILTSDIPLSRACAECLSQDYAERLVLRRLQGLSCLNSVQGGAEAAQRNPGRAQTRSCPQEGRRASCRNRGGQDSSQAEACDQVQYTDE